MSALEIQAAEPATITLADIKIDPELQCRARGVSKTAVREYADAMRVHGIGSFPPITIFRDTKGTCWLADGFQRCAAAALLGLEAVELPADIREGSRKDALVFAAGANAGHGLRRTSADKRRAISMLLEAFPKWSDRKIAEAVGVHNETVGTVRKRVTESVTPDAPEGGAAEATEPTRAVDPSASDATVERLSKALQRVLAQWPPDRRPELEALVAAATATQPPKEISR